MSVPDFQSIMLPLLAFAADKREHSIHEACDRLAEHFKLTDQERNETYSAKNKSRRFDDRVSWARTYLKQSGLIYDTRRKYFQITERGLSVLAEKPQRLDMKFLERFPEYLDFKNRTRETPSNEKPNRANPTVTVSESDATQTPKETIESSIRSLNSALAQELLDTIKKQSPTFFERLVVELLVKMGYGGSINDAGQVVGRSGDEGIDGVIKEDRLGLDIIYIQAKRWDNVVRRPDIQQFAGALAGQRANKGIFITTSTFTNEARSYVAGIQSKIVLIDGVQLAQLMIENNVGVATESVYEVKRIDSDYFAEG